MGENVVSIIKKLRFEFCVITNTTRNNNETTIQEDKSHTNVYNRKEEKAVYGFSMEFPFSEAVFWRGSRSEMTPLLGNIHNLYQLLWSLSVTGLIIEFWVTKSAEITGTALFNVR